MGYELNAIAAAVVGGCSLAGGIGTIAGVMLGAMFLRVVIDSVAKLFRSQPGLVRRGRCGDAGRAGGRVQRAPRDGRV